MTLTTTNPPPRRRQRMLAGVASTALIVSGMIAGASSATAAETAIAVGDLQTNARTKPLGIPGSAPTLSWKSSSAARGVVQSAYEVKVSDGDGEVWSSGKVASADQLQRQVRRTRARVADPLQLAGQGLGR
ncbi:hypothetical protein [Aeromicrobium sp. UC242_57]|uniref:glycoside hydrolase family 78 protein n=1 Tax=Aeromicrobium sp. UC242_57 TaxID=3374624 RepID=UPI003796EA09